MVDSHNRCYLCESSVRFKWKISSESTGKDYSLYSCPKCGLWQLLPVPSNKELSSLYESSYFGKRTSRGYDNYLSDEVRRSIESTFHKNLADLGFYQWESSEDCGRKALEIGAAAGHFVRYLTERKWNITGIDISKEMTSAARKSGLKMIHGNFLTENLKDKYDLIVLWATLEHLANPLDYLIKIKKLLKNDGHLYLTTANTGLWAKIYKQNWRYLNVPEHIFYFNPENLRLLGKKSGLKINRSFTYGSGFTTKPGASSGYKFLKKIFDASAKLFHLGDMIVVDFVHHE